jgi:seryl-tRNA synthetase
MVQELTRQLQSAQSDVKVDDGVAKQLEEEFILRRTLEEENSGLKLKRQELEKELQRVVKANEEQIKALKADIANLEQFLNKAREEIERFQVEGHQVKQTLGKEREMQEEERQKQSE